MRSGGRELHATSIQLHARCMRFHMTLRDTGRLDDVTLKQAKRHRKRLCSHLNFDHLPDCTFIRATHMLASIMCHIHLVGPFAPCIGVDALSFPKIPRSSILGPKSTGSVRSHSQYIDCTLPYWPYSFEVNIWVFKCAGGMVYMRGQRVMKNGFRCTMVACISR
jgi:hypothetical protein